MKADLELETLEFIQKLLKVYLEDQDMETLMSMLDDGLEWSIIGADGLRSGIGLELPAAVVSGTVLEVSMHPVSIDGAHCLVHGGVTIQKDRAKGSCLALFSAACQCRGKSIALRQIHVYLPGSGAEKMQEEFESPRSCQRKFPELVRGFPGVVICFDGTPELELLGVSDGFVKLCGCTRAEIISRFGRSYAGMIFPEDRPTVVRQVQEQALRHSTEELLYRIVGRNGALIWVSSQQQVVDRGDSTFYFCCVLCDKTADRQAWQELQSSLERYQIIASQTDDIIFEWDLENDRVRYSESWEAKFGCPAIPTPPDSGGKWDERIYPEDGAEVCRLMRSIRSGTDYDEAEMRLADESGRYIWCRMRITLQRAEGEGRRRGVGVIIDIDSSKRQTQRLRRLAEQDVLTGVYNRGTAQDLIVGGLSNARRGEKSALFLLDVDDFKQINDQYGHLGGDAVLADVASVLQETFRSGDVVGRLGGDEFCVFLSGVWSRKVLVKKAEDILKVFRRLLTRKGRRSFSCSIGIAVSPEDGTDYLTLFRNADIALYHAKEKGKNRYSFYHNMMLHPQIREGPVLAEDQEVEDSKKENLEDLENSMFRMLYRSKNFEKTLPLLLEMLGRRMGVSRVSLFELREDHRYIWNSFEWCAPGVPSKKHSYTHIDLWEIEKSFGTFKKNGMLYIRSAFQLPAGNTDRQRMERNSVRAALHCAIHDGDKMVGAIGLDDCKGSRNWTREQVEALGLAADIVGAFLIRHRERERAELQVAGLVSALDSQRAWIYAVDPGSCRLLYLNRMAWERRPDLRAGERYLEAFSRVGLSAENPMEMPADGLAAFILGEDFGSRVEVVKNTIPWEGDRTALLVSCYPTEEEEE